MIDLLSILLRIAGAGLILLAVIHIPIGRRMKWRDECLKMSPANAAVFRVHTFFICLVLILMGLPCLFEPRIFLETSRAGLWLSLSISAFWAMQLYFQFFVYRADLWRGKRMETAVHISFSVIWTALTLLFSVCGIWQLGGFR